MDGVGVKRLRDLTMEDFLRFVQMSTDTLPYHSGRQVSEILYIYIYIYVDELKSEVKASLKQGEQLKTVTKIVCFGNFFIFY